MKTISELQKRIYEINVNNGWYEEDQPIGVRLAVIHSEVSEALEADRNGKRNKVELFLEDLRYGRLGMEDFTPDNESAAWIKNRFETTIKDSFADELADVVIRVLDLAQHENIDLESHIEAKIRYNALRGYKHGGKKY